MKKFVFLILGVLVICNTSNAQYRIEKKQFDYRSYTPQVGDLYNPAVAGLSSLLVPGLGQMLSGETGRGLAFLAGSTGCWTVCCIGAIRLLSVSYAGVGPDDAAGAVAVVGGASLFFFRFRRCHCP